eukprot:2354064-Rhodomonas_salina.2
MVYRCPGCDEVVSVNQDAKKQAQKKRMRFEQAEDGRCSHCHSDEATHRGPNKVCVVSRTGSIGSVRSDSMNGEVLLEIGIPVEENSGGTSPSLSYGAPRSAWD